MPKRNNKAAGSPEAKQRIAPAPKGSLDLEVAEPVAGATDGPVATGADRLTFDGYALTWHGSHANSWLAFSGPADESAGEATNDVGPMPQGLFAVDPSTVEQLEHTPDWGSYRVRLDPYAATVDRMKSCLKVIRTGMYIHGGEQTGTHGCIGLNKDKDEAEFAYLLKKYGKKFELEVRYAGAREKITSFGTVRTRSHCCLRASKETEGIRDASTGSRSDGGSSAIGLKRQVVPPPEALK